MQLLSYYVLPCDLFNGQAKAGEEVEKTPAYEENGTYTFKKGHQLRNRYFLPKEIVENWKLKNSK